MLGPRALFLGTALTRCIVHRGWQPLSPRTLQESAGLGQGFSWNLGLKRDLSKTHDRSEFQNRHLNHAL